MSQSQTASGSTRIGNHAEAAAIGAVPGIGFVPDSEAQHYDVEPVIAIGSSDTSRRGE